MNQLINHHCQHHPFC